MAPIVHTYRSGETGLFVNSYLVEGTEGVVAIDAPLLLSDGRAFRARLEALMRPLLGVLVTHPHPDHYNTITELLAGEHVPVIAHRDVEREDPSQGRRQARPMGTDVRGRVAHERNVPQPDGGRRGVCGVR